MSLPLHEASNARHHLDARQLQDMKRKVQAQETTMQSCTTQIVALEKQAGFQALSLESIKKMLDNESDSRAQQVTSLDDDIKRLSASIAVKNEESTREVAQHAVYTIFAAQHVVYTSLASMKIMRAFASLEERLLIVETELRENGLGRCNQVENDLNDLKTTVEKMNATLERIEEELSSNLNIVLQKQEFLENRLYDLEDDRQAVNAAFHNMDQLNNAQEQVVEK